MEEMNLNIVANEFIGLDRLSDEAYQQLKQVQQVLNRYTLPIPPHQY